MKILDSFDHFILDMDGVVYTGDRITPYADKAVSEIRKAGKSITFITNNPTKSRKQYVDKLKGLGIHAFEDEIITSCQAVNYYLKTEVADINKKLIYVAGSIHLKEEVLNTGAHLVTDTECAKADIAIVGSHNEFNYSEIKCVSIALQNNALFLATNCDKNYPSEKGVLPATGALVASVVAVTGREPVVAGKPSEYIFRCCTSLNRENTVIIGDSLDTDIIGGINYGIKTALALTGLTSRQDVDSSEIKPDYIIDNLSQIFE